ncbi:CHAT domain-containing protein [Dyadobacter diqingensis]|uniref:CHAT domain-containing protein n=1 Tax=Dyadobacter diqingensis TaxID=2938121 RepID=UPI0020C52FC0|nr:CHAT domain-containing tetratricopeptide repeat protein [Dyadobacter diqingensis]
MTRKLILIVIILLYGTDGRAQCGSSNYFYEDLNVICRGGLDGVQKVKLENWLRQWKKCFPVADSTYIRALLQLGMVHRFAGDFDNAIAVTQQVIEIYSKKENTLKRKDLVKATYRIGVYYNSSQSAEKAIAYLNEAIQIGKNDAESKTYLASAYLYLVYAFFIKGDFQKALSYADLGEKMATEIKDTITLSDILQQKAQALSQINQNSEARTEVLKAIKLIENIPEACYSLANQHRILGYMNKALQLKKEELAEYETAYKIAAKCNHKNLSDFLNAIGYYYYENADYQRAISYFQRAIDIDKSMYSKSSALNGMALAYARKHAYDKAFQYFQEGLVELLGAGQLSGINSMPTAKSISITAQKDYLLSLIRDKADTWVSYSKSTKNDPEKLKNALKGYMLADSMIDFMRWEHTGKVSKLFWRNKTKGMYEQAIETCFLLKDPSTAFYFFEKSRAVLLNDQLNELGANMQLSVQDAEKERKVSLKIMDLQNKLEGSKRESAAHSNLLAELVDVQEEQQVFIHQLEKANPQYYAYKYDNRIPTISEIRSKVIAEGQTFISYFEGDYAVYGLSISAGDIKLKKIDIGDYKRFTAQFQRLLSDKEMQNKRFGSYLGVAYRLYGLVLKPFNVKSNRVIISPDGNFMPFQSFSFSSDRPDFLIRKYAFSYTYSASFLVKSVRKGNDFLSSKIFLGMAPVKFSPRLNQVALPGSDISLEAISDHFYFPKTLTQSSASRKAFLQELPDYRIIQLLTHASADSSEVEPTLYFADSTLKLSELPTSGLSKTQLLVLSACRTGVGKNQKGEGVFSLARGFAGIGIPSTLTTLWSVENKAIYELTALFYDQLDKGVPLDIALQQAQIEWLATASKSDQLPYSWAGMVLVGNTEPVETGISKGGIYAISATTAFALLLGGFLFRRKMAARR